MHLIIDANILNGYHREISQLTTPLTASAIDIFNKLGNGFTVYLDESGHIENEWRSQSDPEWFKEWYADLLIRGAAYQVEVPLCNHIRDKIREFGFPYSKDIWYIRTAKAIVDLKKSSLLITEDLDYYNPRQKRTARGKARLKILENISGPIPKYLRRNFNIIIKSVCNC